jgi:nitroreductase
MAMDIKQAIFGRRAVREYTAETVDEETIRLLIRAAVYAPSAVNQQPWAFTVVRGEYMLDRIAHDAKSHMLATMPMSQQSDHFLDLWSRHQILIFFTTHRC